MSAIKVIREIKEIHPEDVIISIVGAFCKVYGKDAYIIARIFGYKIIKDKDNNIFSCGFPKKSLNKVIAQLEHKKINYIVVNNSDNYNVEHRENFKNLNNYKLEFYKSSIYVKNIVRINKINENLLINVKNEKLSEKLGKIEKIINET